MVRAAHIAFLLLISLVVLTGFSAYGIFLHTLKSPGPLAAEKPVLIASGQGTQEIAEKLAAEGVISHPLVFAVTSKLQSAGGSLKAGEYLVPAGASTQDVIRLLQSGRVFQRKITVAEGLMSTEIVDLINAAPALEGTIETIPAEGTLLPETYNYVYGDTRQQVIDRMQAAMKKTLAELWEKRSTTTPVKTPEEAVTLASIVEKETGIASERPRVAGVFANRLRIGMPLQSDPTVIYAITMGKMKLERQLYRKDLNIESPYNTYFVKGLPPGPIANPGRASLDAVLNPESNDLYYFVADGTGGHVFGKTLDDHTRNVAKWREIQRKSAQ